MAAVHPPQQHAAVFDDAGQLYRLIADTIPLMVWTAQADGAVDFVNQRVVEYTGLEPRELEGWGWKAVVHPEDWERCLAVWTRALESGERSENEMRLRRMDGEYRWHHGSGVPLRDDEGRVVRWFGIATDTEAEVRSAQILESMVEERTRALRESEQRFQLFMDHLPAIAWIHDSRLRYTYANKFYENLFGFPSTELLGQEPACFFPEPVAARFLETNLKVQREGAAFQYTIDLPQGRWLAVKFPFPDPSGGVGVAGIAIDVTERKQAEEALQALLEGTASVTGEQFFPALVRSAARAAKVRCALVTELVGDVRPRLRILAIWVGDRLGNPVEYDLAHTPCEIVIKRGEAYYPDSVQDLFPEDKDLVALGAESYLGMAMSDACGKTIGHLCILDDKPLVDEQRTVSLLKIFVSRAAAELERKQAEDALRTSQREIRGLLDRLVSMQESERRRVADELHDLIGQNLTALGIDLQALKQRLQSGGDLIAGPRLDAMAALVETTIDSIRGVMTDLRPAALEEFGLMPALRWYASLFGKRTGMKVSTNVSGRESRLPRDTELALFRIVQEALTNAAKHSGGTAVEIAICYGEGLRLTVEDDGHGFAEAVGARSARRGGFGLPTMRERAEAHGGTLRVEFPERGTRLVVDMPAKGHAD